MNEPFYIPSSFFLTKSLKSSVHFIPKYSTSQFRLTTFQVLNSHLWPVATILDLSDLSSIPVTGYSQGTKAALRLRLRFQSLWLAKGGFSRCPSGFHLFWRWHTHVLQSVLRYAVKVTITNGSKYQQLQTIYRGIPRLPVSFTCILTFFFEEANDHTSRNCVQSLHMSMSVCHPRKHHHLCLAAGRNKQAQKSSIKSNDLP